MKLRVGMLTNIAQSVIIQLKSFLNLQLTHGVIGQKQQLPLVRQRVKFPDLVQFAAKLKKMKLMLLDITMLAQ